MDHQNNNRPNPFKVPDGYFDDFESRLSERLKASQAQSPLKATHTKIGTGVWLSAAAAVLLLLVNAWVFWDKLVPDEKPVPIAAKGKVKQPVITAPEAIYLDTIVVSADNIVEEVLENANSDFASADVKTELSSNDKLIALELEESGLLVADLEEDLFEEFEILP